MWIRRRGVLAVLLLLGCGSGGGGGGGAGGAAGTATASGLAGMYRVTGLTRYNPCNGPGDPVAGPYPDQYIAVVDEVLANGLVVNVLGCMGAERTTCDADEHLLFLGKKVADGEWAAGTTSEQKSGGSCTHAWSGDRLKKTASGVTLQSEYRSEERPEAACTGTISDAEADKGQALPCISIEAVRL